MAHSAVPHDEALAHFAQGDSMLSPEDACQPAQPLSEPLEISRVTAFVYRAPIATPVVTSFGIMRDRPAVVVRVETRDGAVGFGEVWANFPSCGAEHRARLVLTAVAPQLLGRSFADPAAAFTFLERRLRTLALQAGEWGPFAQALAGVDIALWDLAAHRAGKPLAELIGGSARAVPAYASGINLDQAAATVERCRTKGYRAFKIKVGFGEQRDVAAIREVAGAMQADEQFMVDANQAWDFPSAKHMAAALESFGLRWLEEPLPADRPATEWQALAEATSIPIAGGENLRGVQDFRRAIASRAFGVIQPDACKWGGISGCATVARDALQAGLRYCPHYLGGGIGLVASAHLLAAVGGDGLLEVDSNPNPLREALAMPFPVLKDGQFPLPEGGGLGVEPDLAQAKQWLVYSDSVG